MQQVVLKNKSDKHNSWRLSENSTAKFNPKNVIFSDKKIFTIEEKLNSKKHCVYTVTTRAFEIYDMYAVATRAIDHFFVSHSQ